MSAVKAFLARCPALAYFALTFAISWGGLLALGGLGGLSAATWQSDPRLPLFVLAMLAGPSISGLLLTSVVSGRSGLRELLARLLRFQGEARWSGPARNVPARGCVRCRGFRFTGTKLE